MTLAKSLLFNVTLLVRPGLEPKIARFCGPHGVSCGRGLNPRHGPLQYFIVISVCSLYVFCMYICNRYKSKGAAATTVVEDAMLTT
jgi:hypothetical protein